MTNEIYYNAFASDLGLIWSGTPFEGETESLCYGRGTSIYLKSNSWSDYQRRLLQFEAMKPFFAHTNDDDLLIKAYNRLPNDNQLVKRIVNNIANTYTNDPERVLSDKSIIDNDTFNNAMSQADKVSYLSGSCLIRPFFKNGELDFYIFTPDLYRVQYDAFDEPEEVWIAKAKTAKSIHGFKVQYDLEQWTKEQVITHDGDKKTVEANSYGFLPFVELRTSDNSKDFNHNEGGQFELCEIQIMNNIFEFLIEENAVLGSIGFWLGKNLDLRGTELKVGVGRLLNITTDSRDGDASISFENAQLLLDELQGAKLDYTKDKLKQYGLPSSVIDDGGVLSGVAMEIDRLELLEMQKQRRKKIEKYDKKLFELIQEIASKDNFFVGNEYEIKFKESEVLTDPQDKHDLLKARYEEGLISKVDWLRAIGHEGTDEELLNYLKEVQNERLDTSNESGSGTGAEAQTSPTTGTNNQIDVPSGDGNTGGTQGNEEPTIEIE